MASAYAFGSAVKGNLSSSSDFDLLVEPDSFGTAEEIGERLWNFEEELSALLKRPVDMLTKRSLKNPFLKQSIERHGVKLYG